MEKTPVAAAAACTTLNGSTMHQNGVQNGGTGVIPTSDKRVHEGPTSLRTTAILVVAIPILVISFALYITALGIHQFAHDYILPQLDLMIFDDNVEGRRGGLTYYHRICTEPSTVHAADLLVTPSSNARAQMQRHGATLIPGLLTERTAQALREWILRQNEISEDLIYVIENTNRWSFPIRVDQDPTVATALAELLSHAHLVDLLEDLCGPDPAVIEFTAITAAEGAAVQYWHQDGRWWWWLLFVASGGDVWYMSHTLDSSSNSQSLPRAVELNSVATLYPPLVSLCPCKTLRPKWAPRVSVPARTCAATRTFVRTLVFKCRVRTISGLLGRALWSINKPRTGEKPIPSVPTGPCLSSPLLPGLDRKRWKQE